MGIGVNHIRYELHTDGKVHTGEHKEERVDGRLEQHDILCDIKVGVEQAEVSDGETRLGQALHCLEVDVVVAGTRCRSNCHDHSNTDDPPHSCTLPYTSLLHI